MTRYPLETRRLYSLTTASDQPSAITLAALITESRRPASIRPWSPFPRMVLGEESDSGGFGDEPNDDGRETRVGKSRDHHVSRLVKRMVGFVGDRAGGRCILSRRKSQGMCVQR